MENQNQPNIPKHVHKLLWILLGVLLLIVIAGSYFWWQTIKQTAGSSKQAIETLAGVDADNNGVRDDVQKYIEQNYSNSLKSQKALLQFAKSVQETFTSLDAKTVVNNQAKAQNCMIYVFGPSEAEKKVGLIEGLVINNPQRLSVWGKKLNDTPATPEAVPNSELASFCDFDVNSTNNPAPTLGSDQSAVPSDWKTYTNSQYGFEIKYPAAIKFYAEPQNPSETLPQCSNNIGCFYYAPGKTAKYSTFSDAILGINIDPTLNESECYNSIVSSYDGKPLPKKNVEINGVAFSEISDVVAATGLRTSFDIYSTVYKGTCFQLSIEIDYGRNNYGVSDPEYQPTEDQTKFDIDSAQKQLSQSVFTFKFTK
jgi:hypothetical protein